MSSTLELVPYKQLSYILTYGPHFTEGEMYFSDSSLEAIRKEISENNFIALKRYRKYLAVSAIKEVGLVDEATCYKEALIQSIPEKHRVKLLEKLSVYKKDNPHKIITKEMVHEMYLRLLDPNRT